MRTRLYFSYYKRAFFIKALKYRRFGNDIVQSVSVVFHGAFRWLFFTIKNHLCAGDYAATVCALKSTQLIQGRTTRCVTSTQEQYPSLFGKRFNFFVIRKTTFRTRKRFQSKDQPLESERTHFYVRFNNSSIAMHRPTTIFLLSHKITTVQSKTAEINNHTNQPQNQSGNTITTNNHSTKYYVLPKTTILSISRENNHDNQSPAFAKQKHAQNKPNKQPTQSLDQKHPKTNTTSNYEKMQCF